MTCFGFASGNPGILLILYIEFEAELYFSSCLAGWYTSQEIYVMIPDHGQNVIGFEDGQDTLNISNLKLIFQSVLMVMMGNRPVSLNWIWTKYQKLAGIHYHANFGAIIFQYAPRITVGNQQKCALFLLKKFASTCPSPNRNCLHTGDVKCANWRIKSLTLWACSS